MRRFLLTLLMMVSLSSCATDLKLRLYKHHKGIAPELQTYVHEFQALSDGKVTDEDMRKLSIGFRKYEDGSTIAGTCHYGVVEVDVSIDWWNRDYSASDRMELIFHELGHCILKRGHTVKPTHDGFLPWIERLGFKLGIFKAKGYLNDGCPASFMHPYTFGDYCVSTHFKYYMDELFERDGLFVVHRDSEDVHFRPKCSEPNIINKTKEWNKVDIRTLKNTKLRCIQVYGSCLKLLIKKAHHTYNAICE